MPDSPHKPYSLLSKRITFFNARDREILLARVIVDDKTKAETHRALTHKEIMGTLLNWRNYPHVLMAISLISTTAALGAYQPLLIKGFGFSTIKANAMSSVGGWINFVLVLAGGFVG